MIYIALLIGIVLAVGGLIAVWAVEARAPRVICLMYHRLAPREVYAAIKGTERIFTVPVDEFDRQISYLKQNAYSFVTPEQVHAFATGRAGVPPKAVLISFDDGCRSFRTLAAPVLQRHGACAVVFVTTDPTSRIFRFGAGQERLTDADLAQLDPAVACVGSHGVTHRPLRGMPESEVRQELAESRQQLERLIGRPVRYLSIPHNWFNRRILRIARESGYEAVWCSWVGVVRPGCYPLSLRRVNVEGPFTLAEFARALTPLGIAQRRLVSLIKTAPGWLLGPKLWTPLRRALLRVLPGGYISFKRWRLVGAATAALLIGVGVLFVVLTHG